ncbi:MAG: hypothetical protein Q8O34_00790 [Rhodocyclaceae bacterium]|nr:hypothetical protein [Rhodocyclaceae bacterium]
MKPLTAADVACVGHLLPYTALHILRVLGEDAGLALLNTLPGVQITVPRHPDRHPAGARRWAMLAGIVGADGMAALADEFGATVLEIPVCDEARKEARNRAIRAEFDRLTMKEGASKAQAIYELGLLHRPITYRQLEKIVDRPDVVESRQAGLF